MSSRVFKCTGSSVAVDAAHQDGYLAAVSLKAGEASGYHVSRLLAPSSGDHSRHYLGPYHLVMEAVDEGFADSRCGVVGFMRHGLKVSTGGAVRVDCTVAVPAKVLLSDTALHQPKLYIVEKKEGSARVIAFAIGSAVHRNLDGSMPKDAFSIIHLTDVLTIAADSTLEFLLQDAVDVLGDDTSSFVGVPGEHMHDEPARHHSRGPSMAWLKEHENPFHLGAHHKICVQFLSA